MARIRSIHPGLFTDEHYMALSLGARELVKGIWCEADDHGVFEWKPTTLKARILPNDAVDMAALLGELVEHQFVRRITADGRDLGFVRNFCRYQRPKKPKYAQPLPQQFRTWVGLSDDGGELVPPLASEPVPHPSPTAGGKPPQREEGGGRMDVPVADATGAAAPGPLDLKSELWKVGRAFLAKHGFDRDAAGKLLGKWRKSGGDVAVINALAAAEAECAQDVVSFIEGCLKRGQNGKSSTYSKADDRSDFRSGLARAALARMGPSGAPVPSAEPGRD